MKRREFLRTAAASVAGAGGATALLVGCGGEQRAAGQGEAPAVHTRKAVRRRLASSFPRGLDTMYGGAEVLAEPVKAMSGGRFEIRPYPAGELVPGLQVLDAVQQGTVQIGQTASYCYTGKNPALAFDTWATIIVPPTDRRSAVERPLRTAGLRACPPPTTAALWARG